MSKEILELKERIKKLEKKIQLLTDLIIDNNIKELNKKNMSNKEIADTLINNGWELCSDIDCLDNEDLNLSLDVDLNKNKLSIELFDDDKYTCWYEPCIFSININLNKQEIAIYQMDMQFNFKYHKEFKGLEYNKILRDALENKLIIKLDKELILNEVIGGYKTDVEGIDIWDERFNIEYNNPYYCIMYRVDDFYENPIYELKKGDYLIDVTRSSISSIYDDEQYDFYDGVEVMKIINKELGDKILEQEHQVALGMILDNR